MLYVFPPGTQARARRPYVRHYERPIRVRAGDVVAVDEARSATTDVVGWLWCRALDGGEGWAPEAWIDDATSPLRMRRDFDALELTVAVGDVVDVVLAESGFVWCRTEDGREGWLPDGVLALAGRR